MVHEALEDNEQVIKFHRMIYEEWYFKKLSNSKDTQCQNEIQPLENNEQNISATIAHRRSRRYKYKYQGSRSSTNIDSTRNKIETNNSLIDKQSLNIIKVDSIDEKIDVVSNNSVEQLNQTVDHENDTRVIEIWNNSFSRPNQSRNKTDNAFKETRVHCPDNRPSREQRIKKLISFEAWKEKKTIQYRQTLKKQQYEKQQQLLANLENMERRKIALQEQARKRQQQKYQRNQKLSKKYLDTIKPTNVTVEPIESTVKPTVAALEEQKDAKLNNDRKTTLITR
ncbi:uncharacterized protein LOC143345698 [Colletes latitarsis]|uniref:uncharacterized protein LOC143345698 n=1 Tax=Colletes latitarsis TaxID=2605962 RepID=UPI0040363FEF